MDGNGGCCIARWTDAGPVVSGYDQSKMDMIMLKFRPIAPKPVSPTGTPAATSDCSNNSPRDGPHAKGPTRGRRKNNLNTNNNSKVKVNKSSNNNGRKRKSSSPENRTAEIIHQDQTVTVGEGGGGGGVTLLPLFPEAPDLSPTKQQEENNNNNNNNKNMPIWVNYNNTPVFENNYGNCHGYGW